MLGQPGRSAYKFACTSGRGATLARVLRRIEAPWLLTAMLGLPMAVPYALAAVLRCCQRRRRRLHIAELANAEIDRVLSYDGDRMAK